MLSIWRVDFKLPGETEREGLESFLVGHALSSPGPQRSINSVL